MGERQRECEDLDADELRPFSAAWIFHWHDRIAAKQSGRLFLFLLSGWFGSVLATFSMAFEEWEDFVTLSDSTIIEISDVLNPFLFVLWPLAAMITPPWSILHLFLCFGLAVGAFIYLSEPWPSPMWLIGFATYGSVVPLISDETAIPSFLILGVFWVGLGGLGWYALQFYHRDFLEKVRRRLTGEPDPAPESEKADEDSP